MADTWYAWSPIRHSAEVDPDTGVASRVNVVKFGDTVTKAKLKVSDDDWDALVQAGSVRNYAPPDGFDGTSEDESPVQYLQRKAREAAEAPEVSAMQSLGGSYFGPAPEEVMMNPELLTGEEKK